MKWMRVMNARYMDIKPTPKTSLELHEHWKNYWTAGIVAGLSITRKIPVTELPIPVTNHDWVHSSSYKKALIHKQYMEDLAKEMNWT